MTSLGWSMSGKLWDINWFFPDTIFIVLIDIVLAPMRRGNVSYEILRGYNYRLSLSFVEFEHIEAHPTTYIA